MQMFELVGAELQLLTDLRPKHNVKCCTGQAFSLTDRLLATGDSQGAAFISSEPGHKLSEFAFALSDSNGSDGQ